MSWRDAVLVAFCWVGWAVALAALWTLRRRLDRVADAEHELRGAATAIGLALEAEGSPLLQLELARMTAAVTDLADARGAPAGPPADIGAGRLAQVLANVIANAAEHGVGPVEVKAHEAGDVVRLELSNRNRTKASKSSPGGGRKARGPEGRGRGILIAQRAARDLGGRVTVEKNGAFTRTVVELPADDPDPRHRRAA